MIVLKPRQQELWYSKAPLRGNDERTRTGKKQVKTRGIYFVLILKALFLIGSYLMMPSYFLDAFLKI